MLVAAKNQEIQIVLLGFLVGALLEIILVNDCYTTRSKLAQ